MLLNSRVGSESDIQTKLTETGTATMQIDGSPKTFWESGSN